MAGLARGALGMLSVPYRVGASLTEIYRTGQGGADFGVPLISVGNLTCGGTGKTPVVSLVLSQLVEMGRRPVVLSRGYKADADGVNDEARVLARSHPDVIHLQGKDRVALARHAAYARLGDVIVVDDGFQYHKLHRDLNVCCIDATNPFGYGAVLPRGLLREPVSALYRARPVLITRAELVSADDLDSIRAEILRHNEHAKIVVSEMHPTQVTALDGSGGADASSLAGKRVVLGSGVGNPDSFERGVRRVGARVAGHVARGDHHAWSAADVAELVGLARDSAATDVVVTVKDAVKLEHLAWPAEGPTARAFGIEAVVTGEADLWKSLLEEALG